MSYSVWWQLHASTGSKEPPNPRDAVCVLVFSRYDIRISSSCCSSQRVELLPDSFSGWLGAVSNPWAAYLPVYRYASPKQDSHGARLTFTLMHITHMDIMDIIFTWTSEDPPLR